MAKKKSEYHRQLLLKAIAKLKEGNAYTISDKRVSIEEAINLIERVLYEE